MKYIVYQNSRFPDFRAPALFHEIIEHVRFPREYQDANGVTWMAVSAGFWDGEKASGHSVSLKLNSQATDTADIQRMLEECT